MAPAPLRAVPPLLLRRVLASAVTLMLGMLMLEGRRLQLPLEKCAAGRAAASGQVGRGAVGESVARGSSG